MPSLHIGWALWCALAMWPLLRRRWQRVAVILYPLATLFCIIVTANHFWLDGVGGLVIARPRHAHRLGASTAGTRRHRPRRPARRGTARAAAVDQR